MFFILPVGHDQPVYDRPWITIGLILVCAGIFFASCSYQVSVMADLERSAAHVDSVARQFPRARVSFGVHGLPEALDEVIQPFIDESPDRAPQLGDQELEAAMLGLVRALNRLPSLRFGYRPAAPSVTGAVGHVFMHADIFHLLGNMLLLWVAGGVLECFWRRWAFGLLYAVSGAAGLLAHHLVNPDSFTPLVGASGAIAGLIGAYVVGYPRSKIRLAYFVLLLYRPFFGTWLVPALIVIPLWVAMELISAVGGTSDGVAYWAHVGGFAVGAVAAVIARLSGLVAVDAGYDVDMAPAPVRSERPPP